MPRRARNWRLVKCHRNYSVEEAAKLLRVHKNTIRDWIRRGLPVINERRPILILGSALREFLVQRRGRNKRPCGPGQFYCVRCRCPQHPAGGMADYQPVTANSANLVGIRPVCDALMFRRVSRAKLDVVRGNLDVIVRDA